MPAFLDQQNIAPGFGKQARSNRAAGSTADDDDFGAQIVGRTRLFGRAARRLLVSRRQWIAGPGSAVKRQQGKTLKIANQITLETDAGIFPCGDLFRTNVRRLGMETLIDWPASRVEG